MAGVAVGGEQDLVEQARRGDSHAFGRLWSDYERQVVSVCRSVLHGAAGDPAVDEHDCASDTFIRALHYLDRFDPAREGPGGFRAWLLQIARNVALTSVSRHSRRNQWQAPRADDALLDEHPSTEPVAERVVEEREALRLAAEAIHDLPPTYRAPLKLLLEEHSYQEIGAALGISPAAAAKRVEWARRRLRPRLAPVFGLPAGDATTSRRLREVELSLREIVAEHRIVTLTLPSGGEVQLCLRVDAGLAGREVEIEQRRARLRRRGPAATIAWRKWLELADLCYHSGRWAEARDAYERVLTARPGCLEAALRLGEMLVREDRPGDAVRVYRASLQSMGSVGSMGSGGRMGSMGSMGSSNLSAMTPHTAHTSHTSPTPPTPHTSHTPHTAAAVRLWGELLTARRQHERAVAAFRRAAALAPADRDSLWALSHALGRVSRYEEQLEVLARIRELAPSDPTGYVAAYMPCAMLVRFDRARPLLEKAVELDPNDPWALKRLFQVRMNSNLHNEETLALAQRLVRLAPQLVDSWGELSWIYFQLGRAEEGLGVLERFLEEHPENATAHALLAWRYDYIRPDAAVPHAWRAYQLAPADPYVAWTALARLNRHPALGEGEALRCAAEILARFPRDTHLLQSASQFYVRWGRAEEALACARSAVALAPDTYAAHWTLAQAYERLGQLRPAAEACRRALELPSGRHPHLLARYARLLRGLRDPGAEALLREALEMAEKISPTVSAEVYVILGEREAARQAYEDSLRSESLSVRDRACAEGAIRSLESKEFSGAGTVTANER